VLTYIYRHKRRHFKKARYAQFNEEEKNDEKTPEQQIKQIPTADNMHIETDRDKLERKASEDGILEEVKIATVQSTGKLSLFRLTLTMNLALKINNNMFNYFLGNKPIY